MNVNIIKKELKKYSDPKKRKSSSRFFKTGIGEYGEGDIFWGIDMPTQRKIAKKFSATPLDEVIKLLKSKIHEHRMTALLIIVLKYEKGTETEKEKIFKTYLANNKHINNWDLIDITTPKIIGEYICTHTKEKKILYGYARSKNLWQKRIAILATYSFIRRKEYDDTLKISLILLNDTHDLIHKAVGWMLREVGNRNLKTEEGFLKKHYQKMPRTMLRYAIEKFEETKRQKYLKSLI